jgi:hypothetical protein
MKHKIAICIPTREQMHSRCAFSLYNLGKALSKAGIEHALFLSPGTLIANQRHELVVAAREWGATHVMFIDSDIIFKPSHVIELINFDEPVVGGAYSKRIEPVIATAWHSIDNWDTHVRLHEQTDSHIQVEAMALGFCLIKIQVFDNLELPWFILGFKDGQYTGEDIEFFRKCISTDIWLDVQTTCELGHLGTKSYKVDDGIEVDLVT